MIKIDLKALILVVALLTATSSVAQMSSPGGGAFTGGTLTSPVIFSVGSSVAPSLACPTSTCAGNDTGIYFSGSGYMAYTTHANGLQWTWDNTGWNLSSDNTYNAGTSTRRLANVYLVNALFGPTANPITLTGGAQAVAETLTLPVTREAETVAVKPQTAFWSTAAPTGVGAGSTLMAGLSSGTTRITPQVTGNLMIECVGSAGNGSIGGIDGLQLKYGSGNGPANGAAATGTALGSVQNTVASTVAGKSGFALRGLATGLTLGTAYYIDIAISATTGTATIYTVDCTAFEL